MTYSNALAPMTPRSDSSYRSGCARLTSRRSSGDCQPERAGVRWFSAQPTRDSRSAHTIRGARWLLVSQPCHSFISSADPRLRFSSRRRHQGFRECRLGSCHRTGVLWSRAGVLLVATLSCPPLATRATFGFRLSDEELMNLPARWDAGWYLVLATHGYSRRAAKASRTWCSSRLFRC